MSSDLYQVIAEFTDAEGNALQGGEYTVSLLDEDRYFDDKLGEVSLNEDGAAAFLVPAADILSFDSAGEKTPDLYFVVRRNCDEIFRSDVFREVDFATADPVTGRAKGLTQKFGPFVIGS